LSCVQQDFYFFFRAIPVVWGLTIKKAMIVCIPGAQGRYVLYKQAKVSQNRERDFAVWGPRAETFAMK